MPRCKDLLELSFCVRPSVLSPFELHSFLSQGNFLQETLQVSSEPTVVKNADRRTSLPRYHGLEISGTSGRMKNPLSAMGREMMPSMRKSLCIQ